MRKDTKATEVEPVPNRHDTGPIVKLFTDMVGHPVKSSTARPMMYDAVVDIWDGDYGFVVNLHPPLNVITMAAPCFKCGKRVALPDEPNTREAYEKTLARLAAQPKVSKTRQVINRIFGCSHRP